MFLLNFTKNQKIRRIKKIMRGYSYLRNKNQLDLIIRIKDSISKKQIKNTILNYSKIVFGKETDIAFVIINQYLFNRIGMLNFNSAILYYFGNNKLPIIYPLPLHWQKVLKDYDIKVAKYRSLLLWNFLVILLFGYGILLFIQLLIKNLQEIFTNSFDKFSNFVYFDNLNSSNIPSDEKITNDNNIISWYCQFRITQIKRLNICHNVPGLIDLTINDCRIFSIKSPFIPFGSIIKIFLFISKIFYLILFTIISFFRGHWWNVIMFPEVVKACHLRIQNLNHIAKEYLFHNSNWLYRPLWTYVAENRGAKIIFYFYSTNVETFKNKNGNQLQANTWNLISWRHFLVWDQYQENFIKRFIYNNSIIEVVGNIFFSSDKNTNIEIIEKFIAVFDVQPHRDSRYQILGCEIEYYVPKVCNTFLSDIKEVAGKYDVKVLLKRKRPATNVVNSKYLNHLKILQKDSNFNLVSPTMDATSLIEKSSVVISMPFTSTALIARNLGKPTVYYDPFGQIQKDDPAAHGIHIVCCKNELEAWFLENSKYF